jgi:hypothetical protein
MADVATAARTVDDEQAFLRSSFNDATLSDTCLQLVVSRRSLEAQAPHMPSRATDSYSSESSSSSCSSSSSATATACSALSASSCSSSSASTPSQLDAASSQEDSQASDTGSQKPVGEAWPSRKRRAHCTPPLAQGTPKRRAEGKVEHSGHSGYPEEEKQQVPEEIGDAERVVVGSFYVSALQLARHSRVLRAALMAPSARRSSPLASSSSLSSLSSSSSPDGSKRTLSLDVRSAQDLPSVETLLHFMYGETHLEIDTIDKGVALLHRAHQWDVDTAFAVICDEMCKLELSDSSALQLMGLPDPIFDHPSMAPFFDKVQEAVISKYGSSASGPFDNSVSLPDSLIFREVMGMSATALRRLLSHRDLIITSENMLWRTIQLWCHNRDKAEQEQAERDLFPIVRFTLLTKPFLHDVVRRHHMGDASDVAFRCDYTDHEEDAEQSTRSYRDASVLCARAITFHTRPLQEQRLFVQAARVHTCSTLRMQHARRRAHHGVNIELDVPASTIRAAGSDNIGKLTDIGPPLHLFGYFVTPVCWIDDDDPRRYVRMGLRKTERHEQGARRPRQPKGLFVHFLLRRVYVRSYQDEARIQYEHLTVLHDCTITLSRNHAKGTRSDLSLESVQEANSPFVDAQARVIMTWEFEPLGSAQARRAEDSSDSSGSSSDDEDHL